MPENEIDLDDTPENADWIKLVGKKVDIYPTPKTLAELAEATGRTVAEVRRLPIARLFK